MAKRSLDAIIGDDKDASNSSPTLSQEDLRAAAAYFGISEDTDFSGQPQWTLQIKKPSGTSPTSPRKAVYDKVARRWGSSPTHGRSKSSQSLSEPQRQYTSSDTWADSLPTSDHVSHFLDVDWDRTSLGPLRSWPQCLRLYTHMVMSKSQPAGIYWGPERTLVVNDKFALILQGRCDQLLGQTLSSVFGDNTVAFEELAQVAATTGLGQSFSDIPIFLPRHDLVEETWWKGHVSPLQNDQASLGGFLVEFEEMTKEVLLERRTKIISDIGLFTPGTPDASIWKHLNQVFAKYSEDVTMAVIYSAESDQDQTSRLVLENTIGVQPGHPIAPTQLKMPSDPNPFFLALTEALDSGKPWLKLSDVKNFSLSFLEGVEWQGYGEKSSAVVIIPLVVLNDLLKGFLIIGLNPRRPFNAAHESFVTELRRQVISVLTSEVSLVEAQARETRLSLLLAESERRVRRMAELAPVGMYELSATGILRWANQYFFDLLGCPRPKDLNDFSWQDWILGEDIQVAMGGLMKGIMEGTDVSGPLRLNRKWRPPQTSDSTSQSSTEEHVWILYQAYPHVENGAVASLMGALTDISQFKWAESVQSQSAEAARIAKKRQEDFIDITSHEMRNPLSAIQQCADSIAASMQEYEESRGGTDALVEIVKSNVEAAESILLCSRYTRGIIDDVLTLSKLESSMLSIVPCMFRPETIIHDALIMFNSEFASSDITVDTLYDEGVLSPGSYVMCDPARLMQVLVNLMTNAIKFTRPRDDRLIRISCGCTLDAPEASQFGPGFTWSNSGKSRADLTKLADYGKGEILYLYYSVSDTGQGIPSAHAVQIFDKFVQASRRTHIKYGGSGLGLFISRELTEVQGGQIGVQSEEGIGSTFTFYVKVRRSTERPTTPQKPSDGRRLSAKIHLPIQLDSQLQPTSLGGISDVIQQPIRRNKGFTILIVEDNLLNQQVLAKQLRKAGCEIYVANHGGEAIDFVLRANGQKEEYNTTSKSAHATTNGGNDEPKSHLELPTIEHGASTTKTTRLGSLSRQSSKTQMAGISAHQIATAGMSSTPPKELDCILMDWEMPVCDGLTATKRVRELEAENRLKQSHYLVIGVTANARAEQIQIAMEAGMDSVVVKPFGVAELTEKISELVYRREKEALQEKNEKETRKKSGEDMDVDG